MHKIIAISIILVAAALSAQAQQKCTRYFEAASGFSFCPPPDWTDRDKPGNPYKAYFSPVVGQFSANVNVKVAWTELKLKEFVDLSTANIMSSKEKLGMSRLEFVNREGFRSSTGVTGERLVFSSTYMDIDLTTIQFILDRPPTGKFIVTWTLPAESAASLTPSVDASMNTFAFEPITIKGVVPEPPPPIKKN